VDGYYYLANGGAWANPAGGLIVSAAFLGTVEKDVTYTLSMLAKGTAEPVVLELLAGGTVLTPLSSVHPDLTGDFQEYSRTYHPDDLVTFLGQPLTICLGVGRDATGQQSHFDNVSLDATIIRCPGYLSASGGAGGMTLAWRNGTETPTSLKILRGTVEIAGAAPVAPPAYTDAGAQPGLIDYELIFTMAGDPCESLTTTYDACITGLAAARGANGVDLTWTNNLAYAGIEIKRDGEVLVPSLGGAEEAYTDTTPDLDGFVSYTVVPTNGACDPATVTIDMGPVVNAGFENPVIANGDSVNVAPGWSLGHYAAADPTVWIEGWDNAGVWNPDAAGGFSGEAFEGENTLWARSTAENHGGVAQVLTNAALKANTQYVLSVQVGNAFHNQSDLTAPYRLELVAGGVLLEEDAGASPAAGMWELHRLTYHSGPDPVELGQPLEIRLMAMAYTDGLGTDGYGVDFDEVGLTVSAGEPQFKRGDANRDGGMNIADGVYILQNIFAQGPDILCPDTGDANDDENVNIADAVYILQNIFAQGAPIPAPGPASCGPDPTPHPTGDEDLPPCNYCPEACADPPAACPAPAR
jgi:hypothetical protein